MNLSGKRVIITGAGSGIGRALLERLTPLAATIVAADVDAVALEDAIANINSNKISPFIGDLSDAGVNAAIFAHAQQVMGGVDVYFANAGFAYYERIGAADWARIEKIFRVNTFAPIYAAEKMRELHPNGGYVMVITASSMAHLGLPGYALYAATKAALDRFAEAYRHELPRTAQLTLVYPVATRTNFFRTGAAAGPFSQSPEIVADRVIAGVTDGKRSLYPSRLFWLTWRVHQIVPLLNIYTGIARRQFRAWEAKRR